MVSSSRSRLFGLLPPRLLFHADRLDASDDHSWDDVVDWLVGNSIRHVGFDVYDTLLTRQINDQRVLLSVIANGLVASGAWRSSAEDYLDARSRAAEAIEGAGLEQWYAHPELALYADADRCVSEEIEIERTLTTPVRGAVDTLDRIRLSGIGISFLSDMHLPTEVIANLLEREGLRLPSEPLFVSGEVGRWKSNGGLFDHWLGTEGLDSADVAYVGNHRFVDIAVPRSMGIRAKLRPTANPDRHELTLATPRGTAVGGADIAGAVVAAASTKARLDIEHEAERSDPQQADLAVLGATVIGQAIMAFLLAIRARCRADDIRQVVFVARDGDLPFQMAEIMPKGYWSGIELHYVHGNRLTWTLAGAHSLGLDRWIQIGAADRYSFLRLGVTDAPVTDLLARVGLAIDDVPPDLAGEFGSNADGDEALVRLLGDDRIRQMVADRARDRFALAADYLATLKFREEAALVVDIGWRGQTAAAVDGVFAEVLGVRPINYHFGGYGVQPIIDAVCRIERYAFDDGLGRPGFHGVDQCVEMFTGAGQARALSYERRAGQVVPVFDEPIEELAAAREGLWAMATRLAEHMPPSDQLDHWTTEPPSPDAVMELLRRFWTEPTPDEGRAGQLLLIEVDDRGRRLRPMSTPYRLRDLVSPSLRRWPQGSAAASPWPARAAVSALGRLRRG